MAKKTPWIDELIKYCRQAKCAKPVKCWQFDSITLETNLGELNGRQGNYIYVFELVSGNMTEVKDALRQHKIREKEIKGPRKYSKENDGGSKILYVGSSQNNISGRIRQHLGVCPNATYALKLQDWFFPRWQTNLYVCDYGPVEPMVLQILEDSIAKALNPAFGKRGGNGR